MESIREVFLNVIMQLTAFTEQIPLFFQVLVTFVWGMIPFIESDNGAAIAVAVGVPVPLAITAAVAGNWVAVMLLIIFVDKVRAWLRGRRRTDVTDEKRYSKRKEKVMRAVEKYGVPGASLLGPMLVGTHINAFFMAVAGVDRRYLMIWQTIAIVIWGIIFGIGAYLLVLSLRGEL